MPSARSHERPLPHAQTGQLPKPRERSGSGIWRPGKTPAVGPPSGRVFRFAGFRLDEAALELCDAAGLPVALSPTTVELLAHLARHHQRVVTKDELLDHLWPGTVASESTLAQCVCAARKAIGDSGRASRIIKNVRGRGYRLVAAVVELERVAASRPAADAAQPAVGLLPEITSDLDAAETGRGSVRVLCGRRSDELEGLCRQALDDAVARGFRPLEGRCHDDEGMPALWPWKQVLGRFEKMTDRETVSRCAGEDLRALCELMPRLRDPGSPVQTRGARQGAGSHAELFRAAVDFLRRASERDPLVVALSDLQWADAASLGALRFLTPLLRDARIVVLATVRTDHAPVAGADLVALLEREGVRTHWLDTPASRRG